MRQIVNQLAGLLLLSEAVSGHGFVVRDLLSRSHELLADASTAVDAPKPGARGKHHHLHMRKAIEGLVTSLTMAEETANGLKLGDRGFRARTAAWQELIHASNALPGRDSYVCNGDLVYTHENLDGGLPSDPIYTPVGLAMGSQTNLVLTTDKILKAANDEAKRVLAPHERNMPNIYPSRKSRDGLFVVEVALAPGDSSFVRA
jgi:hypothetical protein